MKKIIFDTVKNLFLLEEGSLEDNTIIYPTYRTKAERRISEQEAKQLFIHEVIRNGIRYSVETPTRLPYSFSGETLLSGNIDVSTYSPDLREQTNIEFKATNCVYGSIEKDFQKLILEDARGIFFHVIEGSNSGTLPSIFGKYRRAITSISHNSELTLVLVSLRDRFLYYDTFNTLEIKGDSDFFHMETIGKRIIYEADLS